MTSLSTHNPGALELCSQEPIHIPGAIQPHGALLVLDGDRLTVLQASANWSGLTGAATPEPPVGRSLEEVLGAEAAASVRERLEERGTAESDPFVDPSSEPSSGSPQRSADRLAPESGWVTRSSANLPPSSAEVIDLGSRPIGPRKPMR